MTPGLRRAVAALAVLANLAAGCGRPSVARVVEGRAVTGDFVTSEAYAAYGRAAIAEREGRLEDAARDYASAADDAEDAAVYARLGATLCALGRPDAARRAFADGLERDERAAVVHREQARCALGRGALAEATQSAGRAVALDPDDRESRLLLEAALRRAGRAAEADVLADEVQAAVAPVRAPRSAAGAHPALPSSAASPGVDLTPSLRAARPTRDDVDRALALGSREEAARLATAARLPRADLAARALAHGQRAWAAQLAGLVLAADPGDGTAWAVAVAAGAPPGSPDEARTAAIARTSPSRPPSALAVLLVAEAALRRGGPDAALAWTAPAALDRVREDPVEEKVRLRLRAAIP